MSIVIIPAAGQYGVQADQAPQELPLNAWSDANNVRFRDGYAERFGGLKAVFSAPSVTPYWLTPYVTTSARFWVHAGTQKVFVDDGTTRTEITPASLFTGTQDDRWTGGALNGVLVMNNGKEVPQYWGGNVANDLAALTGWNVNWRCKSLRPFKNYLVALNLTKSGTAYPHMVKWSAAADPGTIPASWDETNPAIDAGEVDLAETGDLMVDQMVLGDANIIYKERSMYSMRYVGGQFIFAFQRLPGDVGALARGCIANTPLGHVVLTPGDVVLHNGQGPKSILTGRMRRWLFSQMDTDYYARSFLTANLRRNEVWVCFPTVGQTTCNKALVWNFADDTLSPRDLPNVTYGDFGLIAPGVAETWSSDSDTWLSDATVWAQAEFNPSDSRLLLCNASNVLLGDGGTNNAGTDFTAYIERLNFTLEDPYTVKTVRAVYPRIEGPTGATLTVEVGATMDAEVAPTWSAPVTYTIGSTRKADAFASGRFLCLRIKSTSSFAWRLKSIDLDVIKRGAY